MKHILKGLVLLVTISLAGCLDTVQEITLQADGSGTMVNTTDMSATMAMAKQFGGNEMKELEKMEMDTVIMLSDMVDAMPDITAEEKAMLKDGTMRIRMNFKDEIFILGISNPFKNTGDVTKLNNITSKIFDQAMEQQMQAQSNLPGMDENTPKASSMDDYFETEFKKGKMVKTLNKAKYANANQDEYLKGMLDASGFGSPMKSTLVINLPTPLKKATGKNLAISDDKKKVTIATTIEDFYDSPEKMEFSIEY
jgi:hypothetical protein